MVCLARTIFAKSLPNHIGLYVGLNQHLPIRAVAQDLHELRKRYPGQEPADLLESYDREQTALTNEEHATMREAEPDKRIAL